MSRDAVRRQTPLGGLLVSEEAVYGLILVAGMIIIASDEPSDRWSALISVAATVLVFYAAHVYAGTLSRMAVGHAHPSRAALGGAMRHSLGLLAVAIPPVAALLLGAVGVVSAQTAVWIALSITVIMLVADGWLMAAARTPSFWTRLAGAAVSGVFGAVLIGLKVLIHH